MTAGYSTLPDGGSRDRGRALPRPSAAISCRDRATVIGWALVLLVAAGSALPAAAQSNGQWWWDAAVGLNGRWSESREEGSPRFTSNLNGLNVAYGVNGFIVHPTVAPFELDLDLHLSNYKDGASRNRQQLGVGTRIELFPRGGYPSMVFFRRRFYDDSRIDDVLSGQAEVTTSWGGNTTIRRGPLRGLGFGLQSTRSELFGLDLGKDVHDNQFVSWSRSGRRSQHRVSLDHRALKYGTVEFGNEDYTLHVDQRADFTPTWGWSLTGIGIRRDALDAPDPRRPAESYNLRNQFVHQIRERDTLDVVLLLDRSRSPDGSSFDGSGLSTAYNWRAREHWEVSPFVGYDRRSSADETVDQPSAGVVSSWRNSWPKLDALIRGSIRYALRENGAVEQERLAYSGTVSVGHGNDANLRKELELTYSRAELELRDPTLELPDLGLSGLSLNSSDSYRARFTAQHARGTRWWKSWGEWWRWETADDSGDTVSERYQGVAQFGFAKWNVLADLAEGNFENSGADRQDFRVFGAVTAWKPISFVSVSGSYRGDRRNVAQAPDVDSERLEVRVTLDFGALRADVFAQEITQSLSGSERTDRVFRWSISSQFAGWLPWSTGPKRRGVIR